MRSYYLAAAFALVAAACSRPAADTSAFTETVYAPVEASGFEIRCTPGGDEKLFVTHSPWQGADGRDTEYRLTREPQRIVTMSSTHVAMLDALGEADRIVGVSGKNFISSPAVVARLDSIAEVGYEGNIDYEQLVAARPDVVLLYGVNGASSMEGKLDELGIPYIYIGDYMEESPLGKAEWIRFIGELTGNAAVADSVFASIVNRYNTVKQLITAETGRPAVMLNAPMGDAWYMASPDSYMALLISDAGGDYLYRQPSARTSVPIDFELGYALLNQADFWINAGNAVSLDELRNLAPKLAALPVVTEGRVFNNNARLTPVGGNDFWESSSVHPDLVLADLVAILHPELLPDHTLYYFRHLQ